MQTKAENKKMTSQYITTTVNWKRQENKTANYVREEKENHMFSQISNNWKDKKLEDIYTVRHDTI